MNEHSEVKWNRTFRGNKQIIIFIIVCFLGMLGVTGCSNKEQSAKDIYDLNDPVGSYTIALEHFAKNANSASITQKEVSSVIKPHVNETNVIDFMNNVDGKFIKRTTSEIGDGTSSIDYVCEKGYYSSHDDDFNSLERLRRVRDRMEEESHFSLGSLTIKGSIADINDKIGDSDNNVVEKNSKNTITLNEDGSIDIILYGKPDDHMTLKSAENSYNKTLSSNEYGSFLEGEEMRKEFLNSIAFECSEPIYTMHIDDLGFISSVKVDRFYANYIKWINGDQSSTKDTSTLLIDNVNSLERIKDDDIDF